MALRIAGCDLGNDAVKLVLGPNDVHMLKNAVKRVFSNTKRKDLALEAKQPEIKDDLDVKIESEHINGRFFVGSLASKNGEDVTSQGTRKVQNDHMLVPLITLLALNVPSSKKEERFGIGCGLPINEFSDDKDNFASKLQGTYKVTFLSGALKDREVAIVIEKSLVMPEGIAVIMNQALNETATSISNRDLMLADSGVADIGAFTTDFGVIFGGQPDSDASIGLTEGIANLLDELGKHLNTTKGARITRSQLAETVEKKDYKMVILGENVDISDMVNEQFEIFSAKVVGVIADIWSRHYTIRQFFVAGGGAKALEPFLRREAAKRSLQLTFFPEGDDPQFQNAKGYWKYAKRKFDPAPKKSGVGK